MPTATPDSLDSVLKERFGFAAFRPGQREAIEHLMNHGNLLCIHPTGFGKSLLYQLPATMLEGITLVISPLLALVRDQQTQLNRRFSIAAAAINSDQTEAENHDVRMRTRSGELRILFVAPEQLDHVDRFRFLLDLPISLVVVDEAHCISTWGHDFRPSYRQIVRLVQELQNKNASLKILGLTATADAITETDIHKQLSCSDRPLKVLRESMDRPNISLSVERQVSLETKLVACETLVKQLKGCGLIYCATRENSELVAGYLQDQGLSAAAYHAGFDPDKKRQLQSDFLHDKYKVIAATNALGMGIDKSDLRFVIHFDVPGSITAYYQEVGRCGRDGQKAHGILLYDPDDKRIQRYFIESGQAMPEDFVRILDAIGSSHQSPNMTAIKRTTGLHPTRVTVVLAELVEQGFLVKSSESGVQVYQKTDRAGVPDLTRYSRQRTVKLRELDAMVKYAEQDVTCRMGVLRLALGDSVAAACGHCSACLPSPPVIVNEQSLQGAVRWVRRRGVTIASSKIYSISDGLAVLDSKLRSPMFAHFMKNRADSSAKDLGLTDDLLSLIYEQLQKITAQQPVSVIVAIPSRTWGAREAIAQLLGEKLGVPVSNELLYWQQLPEARQGQLFNNDQRQENVTRHMAARPLPLPRSGSILLLDDYIGSGATMKEAARVLRKDLRVHLPLLPFTIAALKWKLGKAGFV